MNAYDGKGFAYLQTGSAEEAAESFRRALELFPEHARSLLGLGAALANGGQQEAAREAFGRAETAIDALRRGGRGSEAMLAQALLNTVLGRHDDAVSCLFSLLERADLPFSGWTIPIEPLLAPIRETADFEPVSRRLAERAR